MEDGGTAVDASGGNALETNEGSNCLKKILTDEEYASISDHVREKIENTIQQSFDEFITKKALYETLKTQYEQDKEKIQDELGQKSQSLEAVILKLESKNSSIAELEEKLKNLQDELAKLQETNKQLNYEWKDFKVQRDLAVDEKESLIQMLERRNSELNRLKVENSNLIQKYQEATKAKMAALQNSEEVESLKISLEYKEKRLEHESSLLKSQIQALNEESKRQTTELMNLKKENSMKNVSVEAEILEKTQELSMAKQTVNDLKEENEKLKEKVKSLNEKLTEQRGSIDEMYYNFQEELQAQTKLSQLYKGLCEENDSKTEKLSSTINELQNLLREASEEYGELETKSKQTILDYQDEIEKKNDCIQLLKKELKDANDLLKAAKEENLEAAMATLSPCAASASRLIKSGMTLTQIYSQYATVSEELLLEKEENRKLQLYVTTILNEIEEKAPILKQQRIDYEKALNSIESLNKQMDDMITESKILERECMEAKKNSEFFRRENERFKKEVTDLSRQVCYLIKAVEEARGGIVSDGFDKSSVCYDGNESSAQLVISKKLVTFGSIQDLQENNQKLLALVRKLSMKQEAAENISSEDYYDLKMKEEKLQARVNDLMEEMERQSKMMELVKNQSLNYKKLYEQALGGVPRENSIEQEKLTPVKRQYSLVTSTPKATAAEDSNKIEELKKSVKELEDRTKKLIEEKENIKCEFSKSEKKWMDDFNKTKKEANDLIYKNSKLVAQAEFNEEKCRILETNLNTSKKQIKALEERNQMLSEISAKHEQSMVHLKDEAMAAQTKLSKVEVALENIKQENFLLKNAEFRLLKEREAWNREMHTNSLLITNLDAIKAAFERSEEEGKLRLENQLTEALKECTALRNSLKDEKDRFKELTASLERQTSLAKERMLEEKKLAEKAREELEEVKNELNVKCKLINELNSKIKELNNQPTRSVIESVTVNLDDSMKKLKEYEKKIKDLEGEVNSLQMQLAVTKQHNSQYCEMAESLEKQLAEVNEEHSMFRSLMTEKIDESIKHEIELKSKYEELEAKYQAITKVQKSSTDELNAKLECSSTELKSTNTELSNLKAELVLKEEELKKAKEAICKLENSVHEAESKYSNEVVLHSADIQALTSAKNELSEAKKEIAKLTVGRDEAWTALKAKEGLWDEQETKSKTEIKKLNERMADLDEQNRILHESLLELGNQLAILQSKVVDDGQKPVEETLLQSTELSAKTQDQLFKVIKFLRQEKDVALARSEILQSENTRLKGQLVITTKQLEEANESLKNSQESKESAVKASTKHAELLRKIDTLNALTDSNRLLREERDKFKAEVLALKTKLEEAESKLPPMVKEQRKLAEKIDTLTTENQALLMDVARWKQKANSLSERSNKGTPEDWRRLTNERENLAKQWQLEKNNNEKLEDELKKIKQEKNSLNEQISQIQRTLNNELNEIRRLTEESNSFRAQYLKNSEELNATKTQLNKATEESAKLLNEVNANKSIINDLRAKEAQLKKIGKKYKTQFEELLKISEEEKKLREKEEKKRLEEEAVKGAAVPDEEKEKLREEGRVEVRNEMTPKLVEMETKMTEKIREMEVKVTAAQEESENLKKDNENLKTSINEKEERVKQVMKTARSKIVQLTEQNNNLEQELKQIKGQSELSRDESDTRISNLKAQYESIISEMEKERSDQAVERDQERDRLSSQIKSLNQRVNQLQRSLEKQLGSKPSTSSRPADKSTMEPPTANIKPMAGSSSTARQKQKQTTGPVSPCWRSSGNETPFASIRPTISMQTRTVAVLPTSQTNNNQTSSSQSTPVMVLPQQQIVHTTGNSGEGLSSSPTSSHTDYMPATSSATPIRQVVVAPPLSVSTHLGSDAQSTQEMEAEANDNEIQQQSSNQQSQTVSQQQQTQTVAMVLPRERIEQQTTTTQSNQQQNIDQSCGVAYSQANSSNTVTTTQAGLKRPRDVEGDSSTSLEGDEITKTALQSKRTRLSVTGNQAEAFHHQVTHSEGIEVEYQVPTSSQRDQEDDMIIMVDSEEEGNADEGEVEEPDDEPEFEEEDNGEGYEIGSYSRDGQDMGMTTYDEGPDIDEENVPDQDNNEVEVIDDSNEVPNQSGSSRDGGADNATQSSSNAAVPVASSVEPGNQDQTLQQSSEATSSGPINNEGGNNIVVVSQAASSQSSQTFRTRNVPPSGRQQQSQLVIPKTYEESGDDSIVPSTPTLFIPRRGDGFGEAVSSPQVPHQPSFIFSDPSPPITRSGLSQAPVEGSEDSSQLEEPGTGRSVPTTPLQASPQELPMGEFLSEVGQSSAGTHIEGEQSDVSLNIPDITVTVVEDDGNSETPPLELAHFAGEEEEESNEKGDTSGEEPEIINLDEDNDGVTSEGEKPPSAIGEIEEGREAEASEPFECNNIRRPTGRIGGTARRSGRMGFPRRSLTRRQTPIVWPEPGSSSSSTGVGSAIPSILRSTIQPVRIINSEAQRMLPRGRSSRGRKWR